MVEIDGVIVEDQCWLRKNDDGAHINVAELEAVVNLIRECRLLINGIFGTWKF